MPEWRNGRNSVVPLRGSTYRRQGGDDIRARKRLVENLKAGSVGIDRVVFGQQQHGRSRAKRRKARFALGGRQAAVEDDAARTEDLLPRRLPAAVRGDLVTMSLERKRQRPEQGRVTDDGDDG